MIDGKVYVITNSVNGKIYVGQTTMSLERRFKGHIKGVGKRARMLICRAINKHGPEKFRIKLLYRAETKDELDRLEKKAIAELKAQDSSIGYNLSSGGEGTLGLKWSVQSRKRRSEEAKKRGCPQLHTPEIQAKAAANNPRRPLSIIIRKRISRSKLNSPKCRGQAYSEAAKKRGIVHLLTPGVIAKRANTQRGMKRSIETREKISLSKIGKPGSFLGRQHTQETKNKISLAKQGHGLGKKRPDHSAFMREYHRKRREWTL